jgi:hypothetical protein
MRELRQALGRARAGFWGVALFTGVVNILMLMGPLFMLQVYDRVLASSSTPPLVVLFAIVVFLFALMGILDHVRGRVLAVDRGGARWPGFRHRAARYWREPVDAVLGRHRRVVLPSALTRSVPCCAKVSRVRLPIRPSPLMSMVSLRFDLLPPP